MPESYTDEPLLSERFDDALRYASAHHRRQLRKATDVPYVAHLLAVAAMVLETGGSEDEAIAALLHDVVEDGGGPAAQAEIETLFGPEVGRIVAANTDTDAQPKPPWRARKEAYIASVAHKRPDEIHVSAADKLHNARALLTDYRTHGEQLWGRFAARDGAEVRWYYRALLEAFEARRADLSAGTLVVVDELRRVLDALDRLVAQVVAER